MYVPSHFRVTDPAVHDEFVRSNPFGMLASAGEGGVVLTHLPFLLEREGDTMLLYGHMARANPHWTSLAGGGQVTVVFTGPHGYVSPTWYEKSPAVPTWNYMALHAAGTIGMLHADALKALLAKTASAFEGFDGWRDEQTDEAYQQKMAVHIVGFRIVVERIEAQFKLSQNRPAADQQRVIAALGASKRGSDRELGQAMVRWAGDGKN